MHFISKSDIFYSVRVIVPWIYVLHAFYHLYNSVQAIHCIIPLHYRTTLISYIILPFDWLGGDMGRLDVSPKPPPEIMEATKEHETDTMEIGI